MAVRPFDAALQDVIAAPNYQSTESDIRSIEADYDSREIVLEPYLDLKAIRQNENRQLLNQFASYRPKIDTYGMTLTKPFSTGTQVTFGPSYEHSLAPWLTPSNRNAVDWNFSITQDLWKDFFGRSTTLRRTREAAQRKQALATALMKQGQTLVDFESLYWDWALALREAELQQTYLKRSQQILRWVEDRFKRAAAESTDLLQAKALVTQSELRVSAVDLSLTQVTQSIERIVPNHTWQPDPNDLQKTRSSENMAAAWKADGLTRYETLQYLSSVNETIAAEERAKEAREAIRPDLKFVATYGKNAIDPDGSEAIRRTFREDHEYSSLGFTFRTGLDLSSERKQVESARSSRDAAKQRREAYLGETKVAWDQLQNELRTMQKRIDATRQLVDLNLKKADAERDRYRKGRATAFEAITFEQDAVESEISLWQLYALMRKTEARARLFAR